MRIGGMTFEQLYMMSRQKSNMNNRVNNFDPSKYVEPGMDITGRSDWKRIIPVSDDIYDKVLKDTRKRFIEGYGMSTASSGDQIIAAMNSYAMSLPKDKRAPALWTLNRLHIEEATRMANIVKQDNPTWKPGEPFDPHIFDDYFSSSGFDKKV